VDEPAAKQERGRRQQDTLDDEGEQQALWNRRRSVQHATAAGWLLNLERDG